MYCMQREVRRRFEGLVAVAAAILLVASLSACSVKLVQPYDEKLVNNTEAFYKKGAEMIMAGVAVSPRTHQEVQAIADPRQSPAYYSQFEPRYDALILDSEALILRAMAGSEQIDAAGWAAQKKIGELIDAAVPTPCPDLQTQLGQLSLTAQNFADLKCLLLQWKEQHRRSGILTKAVWESRKLTLFNVVFAIEKAERFKQAKTKP